MFKYRMHISTTPFVTTGLAELCINRILHAVLIKGKEEKDEAYSQSSNSSFLVSNIAEIIKATFIAKMCCHLNSGHTCL